MAKKLNVKLPKRVAGIKIPKVVRKGPIAHFMNSSAGQLVLAETMLAAAAAFTAVKTDEDSPVGETVRHPVDGAKRVRHALASAGVDQSERLKYAFREAARAFREALHEGPVVRWEEEEEVPIPPRTKKKTASRGSSTTHH